MGTNHHWMSSVGNGIGIGRDVPLSRSALAWLLIQGTRGRGMQRKRRDDRQTWHYRVYAYGATLRQDSAPPRWPDALRRVVFAQRDLWNACHAAWEKNRAGYETLMAQADALLPLREAR